MNQDRLAIDAYTAVHFIYGYIAKGMGYTNEQIMIGAVLYEMIEPKILDFMRNTLKVNAWGHESKHNILWDILISEVGGMAYDFDYERKQ